MILKKKMVDEVQTINQVKDEEHPANEVIYHEVSNLSEIKDNYYDLGCEEYIFKKGDFNLPVTYCMYARKTRLFGNLQNQNEFTIVILKAKTKMLYDVIVSK